MTAGEIALIATVAAAAVNGVPLVVKWMLGARLSGRKVSLDEIRQRTEDLDNSYKRMERENARLSERVDSLENTLHTERDLHDKTRNRCQTLEDQLSRLGVRIRNLPPNGEK